MTNLFENYYKMPDGTIKQVNPFTGTEVWTVPGRGKKPITNVIPTTAKIIEKHPRENYCNFCEANYLATPPEKSRMVRRNNHHEILCGLHAEQLFETTAEFRRIPNLFEIVTYDYWCKNHNYKLSDDLLQRKNEYLATAKGIEHVINVINFKLLASGYTEDKKHHHGTKINDVRCFLWGWT
jgi:galactose-1-phosphate uridylyltransferase